MDPFAVLGVPRDASGPEIRRAFAEAVRAAHPDVGGPAATASDRLAELIQARDAALGVPGAAVVAPRPPVVFYQRPHGLGRFIRLVLAGLSAGRSSRSDRNLR